MSPWWPSAAWVQKSWIGKWLAKPPKLVFGPSDPLDDPAMGLAAEHAILQTFGIRDDNNRQFRDFFRLAVGPLPEDAESSKAMFRLYGVLLPGMLGRIIPPLAWLVLASRWKAKAEIQAFLTSEAVQEALGRDIARLRLYGRNRFDAMSLHGSEVKELLQKRDEALLLKHLPVSPTDQVIIEVGAGTGSLLAVMAEEDMKQTGAANRFYFATDADKSLMKWGRWLRRREDNPVTFATKRAESLWLPSAVDVIIAKQLIQRMYGQQSPVAVAQHVASVVAALSEGGRYVVIEPGFRGAETHLAIELISRVARALGLQPRAVEEISEPFVLNTGDVYQMAVFVRR